MNSLLMGLSWMDLLLTQTAQYNDVAKFNANIGTESLKMPRNTISDV